MYIYLNKKEMAAMLLLAVNSCEHLSKSEKSDLVDAINMAEYSNTDAIMNSFYNRTNMISARLTEDNYKLLKKATKQLSQGYTKVTQSDLINELIQLLYMRIDP